MNATIVCVGKLKEEWQTQACREYLKRLTRYGAVEVVEAPDYREPDKPGLALERQLLEREGKGVLAKIRPADRVVALCIDGKNPDSMELSRLCDGWMMDGRRLVFVIGGSLGLSDEVIARADYKLSFSKMTFPHPLMRVILLEQLYRAAKISAGERYHK
jgi:23S rRNA (pseudouridine1915-N3)-methyltransferase